MSITLKTYPLPDYDYIHKYYHHSHETFYCVLEPKGVFGTFHVADTSGNHGLIDYHGKVLIPFQYDDLDNAAGLVMRTVRCNDPAAAKPQEEGYPSIYTVDSFYAWDDLCRGIDLNNKLRGFKNCRYGLHNLRGEELLPCMYASIRFDREGRSLVVSAQKEKDAAASLTLPMPESPKRVSPPASEHKGEVIVRNSRQGQSGVVYGYKNAAGRVTIPPVYSDLKQIGKTHILAYKDELERKDGRGCVDGYSYELLDEDGNIVFDEVYDFMFDAFYRGDGDWPPAVILMDCEDNGDTWLFCPVDGDGNRLLDRKFTRVSSAQGVPAGFTAKGKDGWVFIEIVCSPEDGGKKSKA